MATLSARGCHKVKAYVFVDNDPRYAGSDEDRMEVTFALRSDGTILHKCDFVRVYQYAGKCRQSGSYSILGKLKDPSNMRANFETWIERKMVPKYGPAVRTH